MRVCVYVCVRVYVHAHACEFSCAHDEDQKKYLLCYSLPWYLDAAYLTKPGVRDLGNPMDSILLSPPPVPTVPRLQVCVHPYVDFYVGPGDLISGLYGDLNSLFMLVL